MAWITPATYTVGEMLTAGLMNGISSNLNELPFPIDYVQTTTASITLSGTTEAAAVTILTGNSVTYSGTQVRIEFFTPLCSGAENAFLVIVRDSTVIGHSQMTSAAGGTISAYQVFFDTPTAGTHQYIAKGYSSSGTSTIQSGAGGSGTFVPTFMRIVNAPST